MAAGGAPDFNALIAGGDPTQSTIRNLQSQLQQLKTAQKTKAKEVKLEKAKRDRLMAKAAKTLSLEDLGTVVAVKVAKAKAKAAAKARAAAAAAAAPGAAAVANGGGDPAPAAGGVA
jgi:peptidoglycan hydrolase CwlO-like protein